MALFGAKKATIRQELLESRHSLSGLDLLFASYETSYLVKGHFGRLVEPSSESGLFQVMVFAQMD